MAYNLSKLFSTHMHQLLIYYKYRKILINLSRICTLSTISPPKSQALFSQSSNRKLRANVGSFFLLLPRRRETCLEQHAHIPYDTAVISATYKRQNGHICNQFLSFFFLVFFFSLLVRSLASLRDDYVIILYVG